MINQNEIREKSEEYEINTSDVQRDYIFGWVLKGIYTVSDLKDILILKGGNVYRKAYFPTTRYSEDLDFTTGVGLEPEFLLKEFNKVCSFVEEITGVHFNNEQNRVADEHIISKDKKVYKLKLYFKDFFGIESQMIISIRLDITEFDKILLPTQKRMLIHPYSDQAQCKQEITCVKLEEALADKLKCLIQRRSSFDVFDLVNSIFVNKEIEVDRKEIVTTFLKKTIFESNPIVAKNLLLGVPFDMFKIYWDKYLVCPKISRIDFDFAINTLKTGISELFSDFSYSRVSPNAFYPSEFRNKILEAGSSMTLLKLNYKGIERYVEPYSLSFKRRNDGVAQEYFYVYDQTGGDSEPGIKVFLNGSISLIENTDRKFNPRFTVEVSKAGEINTKSYFGDPFKSKIKTSLGFFHKERKRVSSGYNGLTYTIQCSYCGKKFKRSTYSTKLNKHKNEWGGDCSGRVGYPV